MPVVDFGVAIFSTDETTDPATVARLTEERGFESLFFPEHTHIPVSRRTPYPAGGELPREYWHTHDPLVAMAFAAAATTTLKVATGIMLVAQRDPIVTAKAVASLDLLSAGRVILGVGAGWNEEEMEDHGVDPKRRFGRMRESVEAMRALWTQEEASYSGEHIRFQPSWSWPKPLQPGGPPVLVAGHGKNVLNRVVRYGDAWFPNYWGDDDKMVARVEKLRGLGEAAGRGPLPTTLQLAPTEPERLARFEAAGVTRVVWYLPPRDPGSVERALDRYQAVADEYRNAGG
jgi:probable F420-dependent oxidoreductase